MLADQLQEAIAPLSEKEGGDESPEALKKRLAHAGKMLQKAKQRKDTKAVDWWTGVHDRTKEALQKATGGEDKGKGGEEGAADDKAGKGDSEGEGKSSGKIKEFASKLKEKGGAAVEAFKNLPQNGKKFFSDPAYRKEAGKHIAGVFRKKAKGVSDFVKHEVGEFKTAGKALGKIAKREKLTDEDKKALKASAKNIAMTVGGTAAMGHFTITALATHWAAETAIKAVGHSALFAHFIGDTNFDLLTEEEQEEALNKFAEFIMKGVAEKFDEFANASPEEAMELLGKIDVEEAKKAVEDAKGKEGGSKKKEEGLSYFLEQALRS